MVRQRWILHADMDAFYASVEQRERPELRGKPVIVGAHSARGVVAAASYEARAFGVRSAMPGFRARELCPQGVFLPGRMELYAEVSRQVHAIFQDFTPQIEPLALDEAFLDVSGNLHFFEGPEHLGRSLKARVKAETQLDVSVGLASNKRVAKIACTLGKPDGLVVVMPGTERELLAPLPIRRLSGVGPVAAGHLAKLGVHTIGDLAEADASLIALLGSRGPELQAWARGRDDAEVVSSRAPRSCGEESTFASDISDRRDVSEALTSHAEAVAARLRAARLRGRTVTLKIKLGQRRVGASRPARNPGEDQEPDYPLLSRSRTLREASADAALIRGVALELWDEAKISVPVRLLGVSLSNLEPEGAPLQLDLFGARQKADRLGPALDLIRERFGAGAIRRAVDDPEKTTLSNRKK